MSTEATNLNIPAATASWQLDRPCIVAEERRRAERYPISRWYLRPAAGVVAGWLAPTRVRPTHLTCSGLAAAATAAGLIAWFPQTMPIASLLVLVYWFFDRADGQLARRQGTASAWGAWLDGNVDELTDVLLHVAMAAAISSTVDASWPWLMVIAFLGGKYLFMCGLAMEEAADKPRRSESAIARQPAGLLHRIYHLPGNADVRIHLLAVALLMGLPAVELALVAGYYNFRWIVRYALVGRRMGGIQ